MSEIVKCPQGSALNRYMEHMGPICGHHPDECPAECEGQLAWQAEAELRSLRSELEDWREGAKRAAGETCGGEKHCTCVPALRKVIADRAPSLRREAMEDALAAVLSESTWELGLQKIRALLAKETTIQSTNSRKETT